MPSVRTRPSRRLAAPLLATALLAPLVASFATDAAADSVAQLQVYKRLTAETIALIDPQGGTSMGGASTNVNYAVGDILTFRLAFTPVPNGATRGLGGYITEYVPANTQVVGARIVDRNGLTVPPHRGGLGSVGWGPQGKDWPQGAGSMSAIYADTGIFFSTDPRTAKKPANAFTSLANGVLLTPDPSGAGQFDQLLGITNGNYYAHNDWDYIQSRGVSLGVIGNNGRGNGPYKYASVVAGPQTHYGFEATLVNGAPVANGTVGPWQRIRTPGAEIGTGGPVTSAGNLADRVGIPTTAGHVLSTSNPLPTNTNAVRFAVGELAIGDDYFAEISLKVLASPLDPAMNDDVNCAEVFGGDASTEVPTGTQSGKDNAWRYFVPSPSCVKLDLRFELDVDKTMALANDVLTYTLTTQNLSLLPRTGVVVKHDLSTTGAAQLVSATGSPTIAGDVLTWPAIDLQPGQIVVQTIQAKVGGGTSTTSVANYASNELPAPGFTVQTLSTIGPFPNVNLALGASPDVVAPGGTTKYTATIGNAGTGPAAAAGCANPGCGVYFTLPVGFSFKLGSATLDGAPLTNPVVTGQTLRFTLPAAIAPGATKSLAFDADIAPASTPGVYLTELETWFRDAGIGRDVNDAIAPSAPVAVGVTPSDTPTVNGGLTAGVTQVCGTTTEPNGTVITVYVDLLPAASTMAMGGQWCAMVPPLYAGQDVTATAKAPNEVESDASSPPVEVLASAPSLCGDGLDNDNDGLIDFPDDPGCDGPGDADETDVPACSNGVDDDGDGLTDFPDDASCSSYVDDDESGSPACNDGVDDDGDGLTDFPADPGCDSADDASELDVPACANGIDDDGDGTIDYPFDDGCSSAADDDEAPEASGGGGMGGGGAGGSIGAGASTPGEGGTVDPGTPPDLGGVAADDEGSGCGCATPGSTRSTHAGLAIAAVAAAFAARRRRSRPR